VHVPLWQVSSVEHASPSEQAVPLEATGFEHAPVDGSHDPAAWHWSDAVHVTAGPSLHDPLWHVSPVWQRFPSLQLVPFASGGLEHVPVLGLHVPAAWHWSEAVQLTGLPPTQVPDWQVSVWVHAFESLHVVPFVATGLVHAPVLGLHVPAVWHWSDVEHVTGLLPTQVPDWQVSVCVHAFESLPGVPVVATGLEHAPVLGLHVPAVWHWSEAEHVTGLLPTQVPD
jgi:hypothetical protein